MPARAFEAVAGGALTFPSGTAGLTRRIRPEPSALAIYILPYSPSLNMSFVPSGDQEGPLRPITRDGEWVTPPQCT